MCGIWFSLKKTDKDIVDDYLYKCFKNLKNRGPDRSSLVELHDINMKLGFHRLAIMDISIKGDQPFCYQDDEKTIYMLCNGEIYNYRELYEKYKLEPESRSDSEVIMLMYRKFNDIEFIIKEMVGEFSFIIIDIDNKTKEYTIYLVNDRFGVRPMFVYEDEYHIIVSSELKGTPQSFYDYNVMRFPPRHYGIIKNDYNLVLNKYYDLDTIVPTINDVGIAKNTIRKTFEQVVSNMVELCDRDLGCLLSGGLDSSLVASCASKIYKKLHNKKLKTFSIGLPNAADEMYAKMVAEYIDSDHTHIEIQEKDFINAIPHVIRMIESYDITTVRASTAQYLVSKWISENTKIKVLLGGDGSDELTGGYLYFHKANSEKDFNDECKRLLNDIHLYDGLRADRCIAGHGLEARFPFLDCRFVESYLSVDISHRMPREHEKMLLRESFDGYDYLPNEVLYRTKCALSDGCSQMERSWHEIINEYVDKYYSNDTFNKLKRNYDHLTPYTKESLYYRELFTSYYGNSKSTSRVLKYFWLPKWCGDVKDPSARILNIREQ